MYRILGRHSFSLIALKMSFHCLLGFILSWKSWLSVLLLLIDVASLFLWLFLRLFSLYLVFSTFPRYDFPCIYLACSFGPFLNLYRLMFFVILLNLCHYLSKYYFCSILSFLPGAPTFMLELLLCPTYPLFSVLLILFSFFFSLLFCYLRAH